MKSIKYKTLLLCTILAACSVGPDYIKPETKAPEAWLAAEITEQTKLQNNWWKHFNDKVLASLIEKANNNNLDLKIAEARVTEARASRSSTKSDLLPEVNAKANTNRQGNRFQFAGAPDEIKKPFSTYEAGFDASWELDLFGGKRRAIEAASAELQEQEASRDNIKITLLGEVAKNYIDIRQYQMQIALANDTINADEKTLEINNKLFKSGTVSRLDVIRAEAHLNDTKSRLPKYESDLAKAEFATDVLLGEQPGATHKLVAEIKPIPIADKDLVLSAPAKVIANRPDVKIAERKLAAATAQQGVAVAQFFPDVSITGFLGLMNIDAADLLQQGSKSWSLTGGVLWPILNYGKLSANLDATDARQQQALAEYQKSILQALADVETSISSYQKEEEHLASIDASVDKNLQARAIAESRYKQGVTSYLDVLDAKRTLYSSQEELLQSAAETSRNMVAIYKSLGGAWEKPEIKQ